MRADGERLGRRIAELARIGGRGTAVTRLGLGAEEQAARDLVGGWLRERGASVRRDGAANLWARVGPADGPAVAVGSHLDSVPEGGRFDGALGVLCAVEAVETLLDAGTRLRRAIEVVAWSDEEGVRFGIGLFGSAAAFGRLPPRAAERRDPGGVSIAEALRGLGEPGDPGSARVAPAALAAYLEPHIEQGPRLDRAGIPLGVVSAIVGILHGRMTVRGRQDHAGATAMDARQDALLGAAELALALERAARADGEAVGTVGEIAARPGAKNVVPGECVFSIDVRAPDDGRLDAVLAELDRATSAVAASRGLSASLDVLNRVPATPLDAPLRALLARACGAVGVSAPELVSGAGHDAMNAQLAGVPTGMVFIRSRGGSHNPREDCSLEDAALGASALAVALAELAG
ncbi:MAG TPA: Zn-dependent hydrolase [Candidatus Limnocylindrales bacterium]|nr:Zn-dependent hydrolase [Candidatus Limnocylindrales bacterium]